MGQIRFATGVRPRPGSQDIGQMLTGEFIRIYFMTDKEISVFPTSNHMANNYITGKYIFEHQISMPLRCTHITANMAIRVKKDR